MSVAVPLQPARPMESKYFAVLPAVTVAEPDPAGTEMPIADSATAMPKIATN